MFHPIRALQRVAFRFWSGDYEVALAEVNRREAMQRHPSMHGEPGHTFDPTIEAK